MPKAGSHKKEERPVRIILAVFLLAVIFLFALRFNNLPTGYLHSWNQIGTLVHVRAIANSPAEWSRPRDVVTRVVWEESLGGVNPNDRDIRYRTFEEFPLYHFLSATLSRLTGNVITSSRAISILLYFICLYYLFRLIPTSSSTTDKVCVVLTAVCSFPFLYYGQATMSDIGMLSLLTASVYYLKVYVEKGQGLALLISCATLVLSTLLKSYTIVFAPLLSIGIFIKQKKNTTFSTAKFCSSSIVVSLTTTLPVLLWHYWTATQLGHHEESSHTLSNKISVLLNWDLYRTLFKIYFRYLGYAGGGILLLNLISKRIGPLFKPWWLTCWLLLALVYLLLTVDKLLDHDYYFLLIFPPFVFLTGFAISNLTKLFAKKRVFLLLLIFSINFAVACKSFLKATRENHDVIPCAKLLSEHSEAQDIFASLTDISRFSSLAFFANRLAINVEEDSFPIERYRNAGAKFLLLNLSSESLSKLSPWIKQNSKQLKETAGYLDLPDFKGRSRACILYSIKAPNQ